MEKGIQKNEIINLLSKSEHGDYKSYVPITQKAAKDEPEFLAHLIAWNEINGQIRDSKVALPVISLTEKTLDDEYEENSLAHLLKLDPRNLVNALRFGKEIKLSQRELAKVASAYLKVRESNRNWFERVMLQHRNSLKTLYAMFHVKPARYVDNMLFKRKYRKGSVFDTLSQLKNMTDIEAGNAILNEEVPLLTALGYLGDRAKNPDLLFALIENMSASELINNSAMLNKLGIQNNPALRAAYEAGLQKVAESKKITLKTTKAIENIQDKKVKEKLQAVQEKQIKKLAGVDGNWLVLGDRSSSMSNAIQTARDVSAVLAKFVKGNVYLVFFNATPTMYDVTGKTYEEILQITRSVTSSGSTSIGSGLQLILDKGLEVDGIAIVSDGEENYSPWFHLVYPKYAKKFDKEPTVYFYWTSGNGNVALSLKAANIDCQTFDLRNQKVDYYSLPNLVQTMNTQRYSLVDTIMDTPLLKIKDVLKGDYYVR